MLEKKKRQSLWPQLTQRVKSPVVAKPYLYADIYSERGNLTLMTPNRHGAGSNHHDVDEAFGGKSCSPVPDIPV